jgi:hypothetical protein
LDIGWVNHAVNEARIIVKHGNGEIEIQIRKGRHVFHMIIRPSEEPRVVFPTKTFYCSSFLPAPFKSVDRA